jgi:hypothetical protein
MTSMSNCSFKQENPCDTTRTVPAEARCTGKGGYWIQETVSLAPPPEARSRPLNVVPSVSHVWSPT